MKTKTPVIGLCNDSLANVSQGVLFNESRKLDLFISPLARNIHYFLESYLDSDFRSPGNKEASHLTTPNHHHL